jgi:hypothetical protein
LHGDSLHEEKPSCFACLSSFLNFGSPLNREQLVGLESRINEQNDQIRKLQETANVQSLQLAQIKQENRFLLNEKQEILAELEMLSQVLFEEANKIVADEKRANHALTMENEALKKRLKVILRSLGATAQRTVVERRDSWSRWSATNLSFLATPNDSRLSLTNRASLATAKDSNASLL